MKPKQVKDFALWQQLFSILQIYKQEADNEFMTYALNNLLPMFLLLARLGYGQQFSADIMEQLIKNLDLA